MIIGRLLCENCGKDCTRLWGFMLGVRGQIRDPQQQKELAEVAKKFGKNEFVWCWECTASAFGAKTLAQKESQTQTADSGKTEVFETKPPVLAEEKPTEAKAGFFGKKK